MTLAEDLGSVTSHHMEAYSHLYLKFWIIYIFWPPWALYAYGTQTYMQTRTSTYMKYKNKSYKQRTHENDTTAQKADLGKYLSNLTA